MDTIEKFQVFDEIVSQLSKQDDTPAVSIIIVAYKQYGVKLTYKDISYFTKNYKELKNDAFITA